MGLTQSRHARQAERDAEAVGRVREVLGKYKEAGATMVPLAQVLDLLRHDGRWTREAITLQLTDPRADPITGCLPVTAKTE